MTLSISTQSTVGLTLWHIFELDDKQRSQDSGKVQLTLGSATNAQLDREQRQQVAKYLLDGLGLEALVAASGFEPGALVEQIVRHYGFNTNEPEVDHDALHPDDYDRAEA